MAVACQQPHLGNRNKWILRACWPTSFAKFVKMFVGGVAVNSEERVVFKLFHCCKILVVAWHYTHGDGHCLHRALDFIGISVLSRMLAAHMEGIVIGIVKLCGGSASDWQNSTYRELRHCFLCQSWFIFHKFSLKNFENKRRTLYLCDWEICR